MPAAIRDPNAQFRQAVEAVQREDYYIAVGLAKPLLGLHPSPATATQIHRVLGVAYLHLRVFEDALSHLEKARAGGVEDPATLVCLGQARANCGDLEGAVSLLSAAYEKLPNDAPFVPSMAEGLVRLGRLEEAERVLSAGRERHGLTPAIAQMYAQLCLADDRAEDALGWLEPLRDDASLPVGVRGSLLKGLAEILDRLGRYDDAFAAADEANRIVALDFHPEAFHKAVDNLMRTWTPERIRRLQAGGSESEKSVLVTGMPRSGTTLLEKLIGAHAGVVTAGELSDIPRLGRYLRAKGGGGPDFPDRLTERDVRSGAAEYVRRLDAIAPSAARVTDKMPMNVMNTGEYACMMPRGRMIVIRRDPRDVALSCYFRAFHREHGYATRLDWLGEAWKGFDRVVRHWSELFERTGLLRMREVDYERLAADPAGETASLFEFMGLDAPAGRVAETDQRNARTLRPDQINRPVDTKSVARWKRYEKHLGPLLGALGEMPGGSGGA